MPHQAQQHVEKNYQFTHLLRRFGHLCRLGRPNRRPAPVPQGLSCLGLVPSATALPTGTGLLTFDPTLPGAKNTSGYNTQIGFGLYDNFELVGRPAKNYLK